MDVVRLNGPLQNTEIQSARALASLIALLCLSWITGANKAQAVVNPGVLAADELTFPRPTLIRKQVRFWERIFQRYPSTTVVVHEANDPDNIIDVIDYKAFAERSKKTGAVPRKEREEVTEKYLQRYTKAVERFARIGKQALEFGAIEKRLYMVYKRSPESLARLYRGDIKIRVQTGLADDFLSAATTAQAYLPYMEQVFRSYDLPIELTRLPFVESMFNVRAVSKVGASGIWQFMPGTARHFLYVNQLVDERNAPQKATKAAAQLFALNFKDLRTWPLAITAYNHGKLGMERAVKAVGTNDLGEIIKTYDAPSFGFASRNFYAEFLAAVSTYEKLIAAKLVPLAQANAGVESIVLKEPISVSQLLKTTPLTRSILEANNMCLLDAAFERHANKPLPAFYEIRVPHKLAAAVKTALLNQKRKQYATSAHDQATR